MTDNNFSVALFKLNLWQIIIALAKSLMHEVKISKEAEELTLELIEKLAIESLRAEITLFEAAKAHTIADGRKETTPEDIKLVAPMALRLRRSSFIRDYLNNQSLEEEELSNLMSMLLSPMDQEETG